MTEKNWYFTFGSDKNYPFQNGYLIVKAESIHQAIDLFKVKYPNRKDSGCVNCSFYYSQEQWDNECLKFYENQKPFEILSLMVEKENNEVCCDTTTELSREEVIKYMKAQGTGINYDTPDGVDEEQVRWWLKHPVRREQIRETVRKNYCLLDFDEWQSIQNVLFRGSDDTIPFKIALDINYALYQEDITPLELERDEDQKVQWIAVYRDTIGNNNEDDNIAYIVVPMNWFLNYLKEKKINYKEWKSNYTADETINLYHRAKEDGVIMVID